MSARDMVTHRLAEQARRYPDLLISPLVAQHLPPRDAALAGAIEHAAIRRWLTLSAVIENQASRPWSDLEPKLQAVLLAGSAQLLLLDRLPDHAVINEAVQWAKDHIRARAGGLANAVLRKIALLRKQKFTPAAQAMLSRDELPLSDGQAWKLNEPVFDARPAIRLAQQTSHSEWLVSQWMAAFGHEQAASLALHNLVHAPILLHGELAAPAAVASDAPRGRSMLAESTAGEVVEGSQSENDSLSESGPPGDAEPLLTPHDERGFFVFNGDRSQLGEFLSANPGVIVQDPTSAAPAQASAQLHPAPRLIIDACAGKGTKTRQLAQLHPEARLIATDISTERREVLKSQFAGHERVEVIEHRQLMEHAGRADLLVLDVPCSNSGVLARRVEAKYRMSRETRQKLVDLQRQLFADTLPLLAERGRILYSTCSIEAAENQQQVDWVCRWHPMRARQARTRLPAGLPGDPAARYADGGFFAILERTDDKN